MRVIDTTPNAWSIPEEEYPARGLPQEKWAFFLRYAVLAPSSHNSQPWQFDIARDKLYILTDKTRALPVTDPDERQMAMACGAALMNLRLALRHFGHACEVQLLPDAHHPQVMALMRLGGETKATPDEERLFAAITRRRTNRKPFSRQRVPDDVLLAMVSKAEEEGAWLHIVEDQAEREQIALLVSEGDREQWADEQFRAEVAKWLRPNAGEVHDGIQGRAVGYNSLMAIVAPAMIRTLDLGNGQAAHDRDLVESSPVMAVLGTRGDSAYTWMAAGQALQGVLLTAAAAGVDASFLNQPVELPALRTRLAGAIGRRDYPQAVLRLGYGPHTYPSARRPVSEVVVQK